MNERSTQRLVTFHRPFVLERDGEELPAGTYQILIEEELLPGLSFHAYRRTATYIMVEGVGGKRGYTQMRETTKEALDKAGPLPKS